MKDHNDGSPVSVNSFMVGPKKRKFVNLTCMWPFSSLPLSWKLGSTVLIIVLICTERPDSSQNFDRAVKCISC